MEQLTQSLREPSSIRMNEWIGPHRRMNVLQCINAPGGYRIMLQARTGVDGIQGRAWVNLTFGRGNTLEEAFTAALCSLVKEIGLAGE